MKPSPYSDELETIYTQSTGVWMHRPSGSGSRLAIDTMMVGSCAPRRSTKRPDYQVSKQTGSRRENNCVRHARADPA